MGCDGLTRQAVVWLEDNGENSIDFVPDSGGGNVETVIRSEESSTEIVLLLGVHFAKETAYRLLAAAEQANPD